MAMQLQAQSRSPDTAKHWTSALAQALMGLNANSMNSAANRLQQGGIQSAAQQDPNLAMLQSRHLLGQNAPTATPGRSAAMPFSGDLKSAILMQESGNNPNIGPSSAGAIGPGQIMPGTFAQAARPGENINNPDDNKAVSGRLLEGYMQKYGDPARAAVAYYSGEGNVAPPGSPTPWLRDISKDKSGNPIKPVSSYVSDVTQRMGGGGQPQPTNMAQNYTAYQHNPWANPQEQALARGMITPTPGADVYGRPTVTSPMGGQRGLPVGPGVQPGVLVPAGVSAEGGINTQTPLTAPGGGQPQNLQGQLQPLMDVGKNMGQQAAANTAVKGGITSDIQAAQAAIPTMQNLDLMASDIKAHGDNMNFGPSAEFMTNMHRLVANHLPGFMSEAEMKGLAAQENVRKINALLLTSVGRQTGNTDLSLLTGEKSVPGEQNSAQGNLAIIDMLKQQIGLNARFTMENMSKYGTPGFNPVAAKAEFYKQNPIINPLTHNPITVDLAKGEKTAQSQKDFKKLSDQELKKRLGIP
jgi:hypothetical protein